MHYFAKSPLFSFGIVSLLTKFAFAQSLPVPGQADSSPADIEATSTQDSDTSPTQPTTEPIAAEAPAGEQASLSEPATNATGSAPVNQGPATDQSEAKKTPPNKGSGQLYVGFAVSPLKISGMHDVHISDWQDFGTGSAEGRIHLPLAKGNTDGYRPGVLLGYRVGGALGIRLEGALYPGKALLVTLGLGVDYELLHTDRFGLGLGLKGGYGLGLVSAGKAQVLPGKTPPVITPIGTFNEGDDVSANVHSAFGALVLTGHVRIVSQVGLRLDAGYQLGKSFAFELKAGDVAFSGTDPAVVQPNRSIQQAQLKPSASLSGPIGMLSVVVGL